MESEVREPGEPLGPTSTLDEARGTTHRRRCAFLTLSDPTGFFIDDDQAVAAFAGRGWEVVTLAWDQCATPWSAFDAVIIRSTWDYQHRLGDFLDVLAGIDQSGVALFNPLELVRWNAAKRYLEELSRHGVAVVPTRYLDRLVPGEIADLFDLVGSEEIVFKPLVSGNAQGAYRISRGATPDRISEVVRYYRSRPLLVQPFVRSVVDVGEFSLFYFDGLFSHAILKAPAEGDYRAQEEHGARITSVEPSGAMLEAGAAAMAALPERPLYGRVDLVPADRRDAYWVMELELIEPSLYLRMDKEAPHRFAEAFVRRVSV